MSITRVTLKTVSSVDKDLEYFARDFTKLSKELADKAFKQIETPLLDELRFYPPERPNQKYVRTFRLKRGWKAGIVSLGVDRFGFFISNNVEYTVYVVGSLAQAESVAARFQADVHKNRWFLATKTATYWQGVYLETLDDLFADELSSFGTISNRRRAFTRR